MSFFFHRYPYTDLEQLNLDWIISMMQEIKTTYEALGDIKDLPAYVDSYLAGVDWQSLADTAIEELYEGGQLSTLIASYIASDVTPTLTQLQAAVDALHNFTGMFERDSSSTEAHALDFYYIEDDPNDTEDHTGTQADPFTSLDQAFENTLNKGISAPNFRFLEEGSYYCKYSVFNGVTVHMSNWQLANRVQIHFTAPNNVVWYNSHINFKGIDVYVDTSGYLFRGENSEMHVEDCSFNRRFQAASCGLHVKGCSFESLSMTNSMGTIEGTNYFTPTSAANALVITDSSRALIEDYITFNATQYTGEGDTSAFYVGGNAAVTIRTTSAPTITAGYTNEFFLYGGGYVCISATLASNITFTRSGITTLQHTSQTFS